MCGSTELSVHSNIQRLTAFQVLLSASTSAEFLKKKQKKNLHPRHNSFRGLLPNHNTALVTGYSRLDFCGERPPSRKKASTSRCSRPHGLFLSPPLHYPRQGYRVTIMNPCRGKSLLGPPVRLISPLSLLVFFSSFFSSASLSVSARRRPLMDSTPAAEET